MYPKIILRSEGAGLAAVATAAYFTISGPLWLFVVLALAPDISMLAYLAGPRVGSTVYNAFHTYLAPVTLGAAGVWLGVAPFTWVALVWAAHIGVDRAVGYGPTTPAVALSWTWTALTVREFAQTHRQAVSSTTSGIVYPAWDIFRSGSNWRA